MSSGTIVERIPVSGPWITEKEIAYVTDAVTNAWYANANVYHRRFEAAFSQYVGRRHAMALPSCTSAIHLSLLALGIGPGDEVIVPDATWIASSAPISYVGATPVFADVDPDSWCLTAEAVEAALTPRTRAVIAVNLYGNMPDYAPLEALCAERGLALIEDAAESIGSEYRGRKAGGFGRTSVFSFHGSKTLTTGEGGLLLTDDTALFERCQVQQDHGRQPGDTFFYNAEVGYKYKMSSMQAALGLAQLERVKELVARKRQIFGWYREGLAAEPALTLNSEAPDVKNTFWMVTALFDRATGLEKRAVLDALARAGIDGRPFFHPLSSLPAYRTQPRAREAAARNRVTYDLAPRAVNLPSGFNMTPALVERVCSDVRSLLRSWRA
jgi:perosamine synthetase